MKPYQYKVDSRPKIKVWPKNRPINEPIDEGLTGYVNGRRAYSTEERFARALAKSDRIEKWWFDVLVHTPYQIPGQENQVDFFVWSGGILHPIEIDGEFSHKTSEQKAHDIERDAILNPIIQQRNPGALPIERIPGDYLETQIDADRLVREIFYG